MSRSIEKRLGRGGGGRSLA